jgi:hypothetical protein
MRSLRTIARPVVLLALAAWLGVGSLHLHPTHDPGPDGHDYVGRALHAELADHDHSERCLARHVRVSRHGAHHEHSAGLDLRPTSCIGCRLLDEQELAATLAPSVYPPSAGHTARNLGRPTREAGRDPEASPPARGPPGRLQPRFA